MYINWLAYFVSVVVLMALGFVWYGPLFGKTWMRLSGHSPEAMKGMMKKNMTGKYAIQIIGALLLVFVLDRAVTLGSVSEGIYGAAAGFHFAFWNWLGFVAPVTVGMVLWEGKSWKYWFIIAGYWLVGMIIVGLIIASWQ